MICEIAHGPPPSSRHQAAHSCGRGYAACVNPNHLHWATPRENELEKVKHQTSNRGTRHGLSKLSEADVVVIRAESASHRELARRFGVSEASIRRVRSGETWGWLP